MTALLVIIYLSFVGLGLPNSVLGSIWPQMQMELGADVSLVGYLSMTVTAGTGASSVLAGIGPTEAPMPQKQCSQLMCFAS